MPERGPHPLNTLKLGEEQIPGERWVDLVHRGVSVSSEGRVRGLASGRLLLIIPAGQENPRLIVGIYPPGKKRTNIQVSTLVAEAFLSPLPPGSNLRVYHKDLDFGNNRPYNLDYASMSEIQHLYQVARRSGRLPHLSEPVAGSRAAARAALSPADQLAAEIDSQELALRLHNIDIAFEEQKLATLKAARDQIIKNLALLGVGPRDLTVPLPTPLSDGPAPVIESEVEPSC